MRIWSKISNLCSASVENLLLNLIFQTQSFMVNRKFIVSKPLVHSKFDKFIKQNTIVLKNLTVKLILKQIFGLIRLSLCHIISHFINFAVEQCSLTSPFVWQWSKLFSHFLAPQTSWEEKWIHQSLPNLASLLPPVCVCVPLPPTQHDVVKY